MRDIMLDLETFGNNVEGDAAIASIGAAVFDPNCADPLEWAPPAADTFDRRVDLAATPPHLRGTLDPSTVEWWLGQSDAARVALRAEPRSPLEPTLWCFRQWLLEVIARAGTADMRLWSNAPTFDEAILRRAFVRCGLEFPLSFRMSRCCRTLTALSVEFGFDKATGGRNVGEHQALADAVFQARGVMLQMRHLREGKQP